MGTGGTDFSYLFYLLESLILRGFLLKMERTDFVFLYMAKFLFLYRNSERKRIYARIGKIEGFVQCFVPVKKHIAIEGEINGH